jgi:hypothetical protein
MIKFHAHLDECEQCRNHPFELCSKGAQLLVQTSEESLVDWSLFPNQTSHHCDLKDIVSPDDHP